MQAKVILISNDSNFFEYIIPKLSLRKSDELYRYNFAEIIDKIHLLESSLLIINCENNQAQTLELLELLNNVPCIIFGYNDDEDFKVRAYKLGMLAYCTVNMSDEEVEAAVLPALKLVSSLSKNKLYRELLVKNNLITKTNEVFLDSNNILELEIEKIHKTSGNAVLAAISPDEKSKFAINTNQIETVILNNIRQNDVLINFAASKYFLLLYNIDVPKAETLWNKIIQNFNEPLYAGFVHVGHKNRQQLVNEVLNKLHQSINKGYNSLTTANIYAGNNFKYYRNEFKKKLKNIISPTFYHIQQIYNNKLFGIKINQELNESSSILSIKSDLYYGEFKITSPGYSTINIDINISNITNEQPKSELKRITFEPEELEAGLLQDLLEQFINEFKNINNNSYEKIGEFNEHFE